MVPELQSFDAGHRPDPTVILALVAVTVPLPRSTAAALRLVCRATKLAVDETTKDLCVTINDSGALRIGGNSLTAGLTSLRLKQRHHGFAQREASSFSSLCKMAIYNSQTLEVLDLTWRWVDFGSRNAQEGLAMLGDHSRRDGWPNLHSLSLPYIPDLFHTHINIEYMPKLTDLHLEGILQPGFQMLPRDIAALARCTRFASLVEVLDIPNYLFTSPFTGTPNPVESGAIFKELLEAAPKLRRLEVDLGWELSYLETAALPSLEILKINTLKNGVSLRPLFSLPRSRLKELSLEGTGRADGADHLLDLPALIAGGSGAFPALECLHLSYIYNGNWEFMRDIGLTTLKSLKLTDCPLTVDDVAAIAAALDRLPGLETLILMPRYEYPVQLGMHALLLGAPLPRLRQLVVLGHHLDTGNVLRCLIECADRVPQLEEIGSGYGGCNAAALAALAEAGRRGYWPHLKLLYIPGPRYIVIDRSTRDSIRQIEEAWPGLKVQLDDLPEPF